MSQLVLNIKKKSKLPFLKELLKHMEFVEVVESKPKKMTPAEKRILKDLDESVDFVNNFKKNSSKQKSFDQLLREL
ncbi:MAG: hypothetical protein ACK5WF_23645 [Cyclobacteriaceae bacterium]|jgi:hypothetical protein